MIGGLRVSVRPAGQHRIHRLAMHAKLLCEIVVGATAICIHLADMTHLLIREFCAALTLAFRLSVAAFFVHIRDVILRRAKPEMSGIDAETVIAPVANLQFFRNRAVMQFIRKAMCADKMRACPELSITARVAGCCPVPAIVRAALVYLFPKEFFCWAQGMMTWQESSSRWNLATTTTFAELNRGEFHFELFGDMLSHVDNLLLGIGQTAGRSQRRSGQLIGGATGVIVPQVEI